jgi:hypothetical protein
MVFVEIFRTTRVEGPFKARDLDHPHPELSTRFHITAYKRMQMEMDTIRAVRNHH